MQARDSKIISHIPQISFYKFICDLNDLFQIWFFKLSCHSPPNFLQLNFSCWNLPSQFWQNKEIRVRVYYIDTYLAKWNSIILFSILIWNFLNQKRNNDMVNEIRSHTWNLFSANMYLRYLIPTNHFLQKNMLGKSLL